MGEKIKIKEIEGDSDALASFFATSDCSLGEYLNANKRPKINYRLLFGTVILFIIFLSILWSVPSSYIICKKILTLVSLVFVGCITIFIHLCWKNTFVTIIAGIISITLFMIAIDAITPEDAGRKIDNYMEQINLK